MVTPKTQRDSMKDIARYEDTLWRLLAAISICLPSDKVSGNPHKLQWVPPKKPTSLKQLFTSFCDNLSNIPAFSATERAKGASLGDFNADYINLEISFHNGEHDLKIRATQHAFSIEGEPSLDMRNKHLAFLVMLQSRHNHAITLSPFSPREWLNEFLSIYEIPTIQPCPTIPVVRPAPDVQLYLTAQAMGWLTGPKLASEEGNGTKAVRISQILWNKGKLEDEAKYSTPEQDEINIWGKMITIHKKTCPQDIWDNLVAQIKEK